ncbi:PAXNEB-domain-containing protein [Gloeopeniophorella convolvens]|nr:PAXNEB-domain-containing protein [Gloeopeniophorella convolvens]
MSTFKRKATSKGSGPLPGTRASPFSSSTVLTSSGIASLDDVLGGGLPLSCSLLTLAPDPHSSYGELVQKYFISQGLASGQKVCIIDDDPEGFTSECMWSSNDSPSLATIPTEDDDGDEPDADAKVDIAWRYEHMKQFQTTIPASKHTTDEYCSTFDLTHRIPNHVVDQAVKSSQLLLLNSSTDLAGILGAIAQALAESSESTSKQPSPTRICVPSLGSPGWGDLAPEDILHFVYSLGNLLHRYPHTCASVGLPPNVSVEEWGGPGWVNKLSWLFDASVTLAGFSADPSLLSTFPSHHGFLHIHGLPAPHSLVSASDRTSTLRGLSSVSGSSGGGENNLAFKCTRKRLVFETLHLDVEGGLGERRTGPATNAIALEEGMRSERVASASGKQSAAFAGGAAIEIQIEGAVDTGAGVVGGADVQEGAKAGRKKKKVAFQSEQPELYDF